ncbi:MarR family winged helix-turn-helix transcriptional regulator [Candidatus Pantoea multigeneris]|uniref:MarR family transcriptional regulator n=1 Tax=Candidatus Pantoea multigeneris TaxID=2608357 RepID=A0ABX0RE16_9GAMM|nr:MarR family transcriptional regulator [Pantoea multigeneris]NIF21704.1 MarR family transcriptional regulator [Pantoea multigeneris]
MKKSAMQDQEYAALADFRATLRQFLAFSEGEAKEVGLTPQQHQALLAIRAAKPGEATIGFVANRLILQPHSASGLVRRLEELEMLERVPCEDDQRKTLLQLTAKAEALLESLSTVHLEELRRLKPLLIDLITRFG